MIFRCHKYLKDIFDTSKVSLREISIDFCENNFCKKYFCIKRKCEENKDYNNIEEDKTR